MLRLKAAITTDPALPGRRGKLAESSQGFYNRRRNRIPTELLAPKGAP
jgi:hypothetical protein